MNKTQIKGVEIRIGSCTRWGLAFFAVSILAVSGLVARYEQVQTHVRHF